MAEKAKGYPYTKLEAELGLPERWCAQLIDEKENWSFVIKLHALFEAAITRLLEVDLGRPGLQAFVGRLSMGGQAGKLELARMMELLDLESIRLVRLIGQLRNACVHDVRNVNFNLTKHPGGHRWGNLGGRPGQAS